MIYGNKGFKSVIFREEIEALKNQHLNQFSVVHIFSKENLGNPLQKGRIDRDKCEKLINDLGFDAAVNYKDANFRQNLKEATPNGVDVYFDNTGGMILGSALFRLNSGGRIACCGVVSQYDTSTPEPGPRGIPGLLVNKSIRMQGFLVFDFADKYEEATNDLIGWIDSGQLKVLTDELEGLEKAPQGFVDLLAGGNIGTRIVNI